MMEVCQCCGSDQQKNGTCERCGYNFYYSRTPSHHNERSIESLKRIADALEKIERHVAFNNGTLEGLTRNYDPNRR